MSKINFYNNESYLIKIDTKLKLINNLMLESLDDLVSNFDCNESKDLCEKLSLSLELLNKSRSMVNNIKLK